ncbi:alpha/beta hydrolase [Sciscionella marina]|uniref:alpha/beta hydrolase n=1 Tax=Sciscionella marina TaxID=508770 RepID=UPI000380E313|nr:alpha/beta hydrolase [Sciscionella marina]
MKLSERRGLLADGTPFLMRVPEIWNGVLVRDMDFAAVAEMSGDEVLLASTGATGGSADRYADMLTRGFAVAGTARHPLDFFQYDPVHEIAMLDEVLDRFEAEFARPDRVIHYGGSGGGHVSLAVAEDFADRIDGAIAFDAHTPVWIMNTHLDMWFSLKTLIGPEAEAAGVVRLDELLVTDLPNAGMRRIKDTIAYLPDAAFERSWRATIDAAQRTPLGRARIALAITLGQWPAWGSGLHSPPMLDDPDALQHSMYHLVYQDAQNAGGAGRIIFENAARGRQLSWNTGVDYADFFANGNEHYRNAVAHLYEKAGRDVADDLALVNTAPRVEGSEFALEFWKAPGRTVTGEPRVPVLRVHGLGDTAVPFSIAEGYRERVQARGKEDLVRFAFVDADGHLAANTVESGTLLEVMTHRLDTGNWGDTGPVALNRMASALAPVTPARFADVHERGLAVGRYNRTWIPET